MISPLTFPIDPVYVVYCVTYDYFPCMLYNSSQPSPLCLSFQAEETKEKDNKEEEEEEKK